MLMHILAMIHKHKGHFCVYLVGVDYTFSLYVCVICLHVDRKYVCISLGVCIWEKKKTLACLSLQMVVQRPSVMKPLGSSFFLFSIPLILSLSLLLLAAVFLRSRTRLALINVSLAFAWLCISLFLSSASYGFIPHSNHAIIVRATLAGFSCN